MVLRKNTRAELNLAEYRRANLGECIPPESALLFEYLEDIKHAGRMALEIGPGAGYDVALLLQNDVTVHVVDINQEVLDVLHENLRKTGFRRSNRLKSFREDIRTYQPQDCNYSYVGVSHVLHFMTLDDARSVLTILLKCLKLGGMMMIRVHSVGHPGAQHATAMGDYKYFFKREDLNWLTENGMEVVHDAYVECIVSRRAKRKRAEADGYPEELERYAGQGAHLEILLRKTAELEGVL